MEDRRKFSLVCYLEGESKQKVRDLQNKLFDLTGSRACLDCWEPHITVGDGVWVNADELKEAESFFQRLADAEKPFEVTLEGFGGRTDRPSGIGEVTTPYVLWIDVVVNDELRQLVQTIQATITSKYSLWWSMPQPYTPHATLAFRDLSEEGHRLGTELLKNEGFKDTITVSHIALVENLPEKDVEYKRFYFTK
jgi:2'-5' RNA ligase